MDTHDYGHFFDIDENYEFRYEPKPSTKLKLHREYANDSTEQIVSKSVIVEDDTPFFKKLSFILPITTIAILYFFTKTK
jgi:hypothetical protein